MGLEYTIEEILPLIKKLMRDYTRNESSSVSYETAQMLMEAVIYCINEWKTTTSENGNTPVIKKNSAEEAYKNGCSAVIKKVQKSLKLYENIMRDFDSYGNIAYYDTIVKGMPAFFNYYDAKFNPTNHILTLDYPTIGPEKNLCGIDAIFGYLEKIKEEQTFLSIFNPKRVREVLYKHHSNYEELFINICSIIFRQATGCIISNEQVVKLKLNKMSLHRIRKHIMTADEEQIRNQIEEITDNFVKKIFLGNEKLLEYLKGDMNDFVCSLMNAAENDCWESLFAID